MTLKEMAHLLISVLINLSVIIWLINFAWKGNDKSIIILLFYYSILIFVNFIVWMILRWKKHPASKIYQGTTVALTTLFLPVIIIGSWN